MGLTSAGDGGGGGDVRQAGQGLQGLDEGVVAHAPLR